MIELFKRVLRTLRHPLVHLSAWTYVPRWKFLVWYYNRYTLPRNVARVRAKPRIRVVFLAMNVSMWKYGRLFDLLKASTRFEPMVVVSPRTHLDTREEFLSNLHETLDYFKARGIDAVPGYDERSQAWLDLKMLEPDIVFYTQPYSNNMWPGHFFWTMRHTLICYAPYSFHLAVGATDDNNLLENFCWRYFHLTNWHRDACRDIMWNKATNVCAVGYYLSEELRAVQADSLRGDVAWHNDKRKRIIWAPHHTISDQEQFKSSTFLEYYDEMLRLRDLNRDCVIFAFKPHPHLRTKLNVLWGKERTDAYYKNWAEGENSFLAQGAYVDLFAGSDAMIHCCASFVVEYLYMNKPCMYVYAKNREVPEFGEVSTEALKVYRPAHCAEDIATFIEDVVAGRDENTHDREEYRKRYLGQDCFSENVFRELEENL